MPPKTTIEDMDFAILCLKHSAKPNFDEVARELGCSKNAAYHRHYGMMRKHKGSDAGPVTTPTTPKKRGLKKNDTAEDDENTAESPTKKAKGKKTSVKPKPKPKPKKEEAIDNGDNDEKGDVVLQAPDDVIKVCSDEDDNE